MLKRATIIIVYIALIGALAACGSSKNSNNSSSDTGNIITIQETEMKFTPNTFTVKAGQKVTIKLENKGVVMHDFTIDDVNGQKVSQPVDPGQTKTVSFTAPSTPGTLQFYCSQPGHRAAGMQGTITVQ